MANAHIRIGRLHDLPEDGVARRLVAGPKRRDPKGGVGDPFHPALAASVVRR